MLTTILTFTMIIGSAGGPIDFNLGWKQGDKFTYTFSTSAPQIGQSITGEANLTVMTVNNKGFDLNISAIKFSGAQAPAIAAGSLRLSMKGTLRSDQASDASKASIYFMFMALPKDAVEVGDSFKVSTQFEGQSAALDGKFVSLGGPNKTLALLEFDGTFRDSDSTGAGAPIKLKTTFDIEKGIFVSHVASWHDGAMIYTFKLKEPAK